MRGFPPRLTYANVVATLALFVALGGSSYAAFALPANSVGTRQLRNGAVTAKKIKRHSLLAVDFKHGQLPAGGQGAKGNPGAAGPPGPPGSPGAPGPDNLTAGETSAGDQTFSQGCSGPYDLTKTLTVPVRSLLYASAQTQYTALSPTGTHSTTWQITVRDASGQIAATPFYSGGDSGTSITADGMLVSSGSPVVLQPGTTYTLDFFVEVNGNCGGNAFLSAPTMSYISMPAS